MPTKLIALWNNYKSLANEKGLEKPNNPLYLNKAISCIIGQGDKIIRPKTYNENIFFEGELGIVIGKKCKEVDIESSKDYIFGYTCNNDVTAMDLVKKILLLINGHDLKALTPLGSVIASDIDPMAQSIKTTVNEQVKQDYND